MIDWSPLRRALARCREAKTALPIWWRDDDAIAPTHALDQLSEASEKIGVPVHLAIIPEPAHDSLPAYVRARPHIIPCVHGWSHLNTAPSGMKKSEFGVARAAGSMDLHRAHKHMKALFGNDLFAMFVPPWNRMEDSFQSDLRDAQYAAFSTFGPRATPTALPQINTDIDPIFWRGHRGLVAPERLITQAAGIINARCEADHKPIDPLGLLTHHLVHVPEVSEFSTAFLTEMLDGGAYPAHLKEVINEPT